MKVVFFMPKTCLRLKKMQGEYIGDGLKTEVHVNGRT